MNARMPGADAGQKLDEIAGRDRAHHAEIQPRLRQVLKTAGAPVRRLGLIQDLVEMKLYICPNSERWVLFRSRWNRAPPNSSSSSRIERVSEGCETLQRLAARVKFNSSQRARK
jgi:hypothetical protein